MFTIKFKISKSKNYSIVRKLAAKFSDYSIIDGVNTIHISIKEIFEKWDFFNLLFWKTVDWKGTTFGYDGYDLHSHCDKTRIFYALQEAHTNWICMSEYFLRRIAPAYFESGKLDDIRHEALGQYMNFILDRILVAKNRDEYINEFGYLNFKVPLRNSDFIGRKERRELKQNNK